MLVLFDHGTPRGIRYSLQGHSVKEAKAQGWDTLSNGDLLRVAEEAGFDVLLTTDKVYQQSLKELLLSCWARPSGRSSGRCYRRLLQR